jgi:hypothetical protein
MSISYLAYPLALKMEITCSSEVLVNFKWTAWYYIPEERTLSGKKCYITTNVTQPTLRPIGLTEIQTQRPEQRHM